MSLSSPQSRDLTAKWLRSSFSMVPRTRTFCAWAATELSANVAANVATTKTCDVILISFLPHSGCARWKLAHPIVLLTVTGHRLDQDAQPSRSDWQATSPGQAPLD